MEKIGWCFEWVDDRLVPYQVPAEFAERGENGEDWETEWFPRLGIMKMEVFGDTEGANVATYEWPDEKLHPYLATIMNGERTQLVFLPSFDAQLRFLALVVPRVLAASTDARIENMERTASRAFRAWHGHGSDYSDCCRTCDPKLVKEVAERRAKLAEQKQKSTT